MATVKTNTDVFEKAWEGFKGTDWKEKASVSRFVQANYTPYDGDESFLAGPTERSLKIKKSVDETKAGYEAEGRFPMDTRPTSIADIPAGYISKEDELIYGIQNDELFKLNFMPKGGIRMAETALKEHGYEPDPAVHEIFTKYVTTVNDGIFRAYTSNIRRARHAHTVTGLPDAYSRGRIIGVYARLALYGADYLMQEKVNDWNAIKEIDEETIRLREEVNLQYQALQQVVALGDLYGVDVRRPAFDTKEAIQWTNIAFMAVCRVINGAATSLGRVPIVLDIFAERDLARGTFTESEIQEFVDDFVMKLRTVKFARTKAYDQLYSGDPTFITTSMAGMGNDGRHRVTKMDYRFLNTLDNIGNSPEPNLTVLWTDKLPYSFRRYCMHMSHKHSSIQYEGVTTMAKDGYGEMSCISCCVSPLDPENEEQRHNIQYFGARVNVLKALLTGLNGGYDDVHKDYKVFDIDPIRDEVLEFESVKANFEKSLDWLTDTYVDALNIIHYMTDKYNYEAVQMAFLPTHQRANMGFGICGFANTVDTLSAIKYATVKPIRDENGYIYDYETIGEYPRWGEDDPRSNELAEWLIEAYTTRLRSHKLYKDAEATVSLLTITSNVAYSKQTGNSPEPNLTVLWTDKLPYNFRRYCMHMSHKHSSIQYEGVTTMAKDGYGEMSCISCCVSPLDPENEEQRHNIQYFGARVNVLKALLTGLNGGYDDVHKDYKVFDIDPIRDEVLEFESVIANFEKSLDWLTDTYVDALNIIHYMTDKYNYEAVQMAFLPTHQRANMGFGICGFANTVDTLSAIKYATVKPIRDENGYIYDYETIGEYPRWGEDDPRSNELAEWLVEAYTTRLRSHKLYKNAEATVSLLTITSNVAYSKQTGNSPVHKGVYLNEDGTVNLSKLEFFSPGANPSNKAKGGWLQNLNSLASLDFSYAADGISLTTQVSPRALGKTHDEQVDNLVTILDGYFENGGQHVNLNVMDLKDVYDKIMSGEDVIVRISGYCVNTKYLTPEQKTELTQRVFHEVLSMDDALS